MKTDPNPITEQLETITWKSSDIPPWLAIWGNGGASSSRYGYGTALNGRACRKASSFFNEVARTLSIPPDNVPHNWEDFIPWFSDVLDGKELDDNSIPFFYRSFNVLHAEDMFLDEGSNYAREMGRFLHVFVKLNQDPAEGFRGWITPARITLYLYCQEGLESLFRDQLLEAITEAF